MTLPDDLAALQERIIGYVDAFGLDSFPVQFEMVDYKMMNQLAAYGGFPVRYPHWRFGMEYERMSKSYAYGLHRIYEMVINTDPCYAYLLVSNNRVDQKLVMAHVYGHGDFFKNNLWFAHTNRKMLNEMANHAARIRRYMARHGQEEVEAFIDVVLSLENLVDAHTAMMPRPVAETDDGEAAPSHRLRAKDYMDPFINPPEYLAAQQKRMEEERERQQSTVPAHPVRDVLLFLLEHAPLLPWQRNVLDIVREEALYFVPQRQTKIMNEGWASYVHSHIMTQHALEPHEVIDYADHHAGTMATQPGRLNPYKLGLELFRDIEDRWNRGAFGPEYEQCQDMAARRRWDRQLGLGREKLFEVRRIYNDIGFIDTFLTEEFARRHRLFTFAYNSRRESYEIESRNFAAVKQQLLFQLTNFGQPLIEVVDANHGNRGELYLIHRHEGTDLDLPYARETLANLQVVWQRPVHLETEVEKKGRVRFSHDGSGLTQHKLE